MKKKRLPKGLRKFIRKEKMRLRCEILDVKERETLIGELYRKFTKFNHENKRNLQPGNK